VAPWITKLLGGLFGAGDGKGVVTTVLERWIPDKNARAEAAEELQKSILEACTNQDKEQLEVNKVEAAHASVFVAGWRPSVGWVCSFAMAWQYVLCPMLTWALSVYSTYSGKTLPALPQLDTTQMMTVLLGMLGLGGLRTYEKIRGEVDRSTLKEP